jgi:hypothetical protein
MAIFDSEQPLLSPGKQASSLEAQRVVGYALYRPAGEVPTEIWVSSETGEAGLRLGSDLVLLYSQWSPDTDVAIQYAGMAKDWDAGYTTEIETHPAWVVPKGSAADGTSPQVNEVYLTIGTVEIALYGQMPLNELLAKAETLEAPAGAP